MQLDFSRCRLSPFAHQREDTQALIDHSFFFIASEMRTGKSKIVIDAAQFLFEAGIIDKVIIVAPAPVRDVWADKTLGELAKHLWLDLPAIVTEFHARIRSWVHATEGRDNKRLEFYVTNFEFLRAKNRLTQLMPACGPRTLLVGDESSFIKGHNTAQTKAFAALRKACGRVVLLNGTPLFHSPLDLFSQGNILSPTVLDCKFVSLFKARYAVQAPVLRFGGKPLLDKWNKPIMKVENWTNLDDLQRRFTPYTVRRLQKECLDLPPKLDPVMLTATLTPETWTTYKGMRDDLVVWLKDGNVATSRTAAVKVMRLSQITSGFLGGIEDANTGDEDERNRGDLLSDRGYSQAEDDDEGRDRPDLETFGVDHATIRPGDQAAGRSPAGGGQVQQLQTTDPVGLREAICSTQEIGHEKLDVLLWFIAERLEADPNLHLVAWARFRAEVFRMLAAVTERFPQFETAAILGGQKRPERLRALALLKPETSPSGPVFVAGIEGTGSFGIDMCAAHTCVTVSSGYSPGRSAQTLDRVYGPNQTHPIGYFTILAVGPRGQRTIDHQVETARRAGTDVATFTSDAWVKALTEK